MWMITHDLTAEDHDKPGTMMNAVGVMGPSTATDFRPETYKFRFRMSDDDNIVYYKGLSTESHVFAPLDDFGAPNAGCTMIEFWNPKTYTWEIL